MYSGIVKGLATVLEFSINGENGVLVIDRKLDCLKELELGGSIAIDGICLTVADFTPKSIKFDLSLETIKTSNICNLSVNSQVNLETPLLYGQQNGGHNISGHIDGVAVVSNKNFTPSSHQITFEIESPLNRYIFQKGFIGLNGCSLTLNQVEQNRQNKSASFSIWLIPETLKRTNLSLLEVGDKVNIEVDRHIQAIVDTVTALLQDSEFCGSIFNSNTLGGK
jgi:riboflavin synthase